MAFKRSCRRKRYKPEVSEFEYNLEKELFQIKRELEGLTYQFGSLKKFIVRDPKQRIIYVAPFRDRVVHHALCNVIEPIFDTSFIYDSYACRLSKGTHRAVQRFDEFKRKASKNNTRKCYVLKADVKKYFDSVDHEILLRIIGKKIKDRKVMLLIRQIVEGYEGKGNLKGKGLPIGNLTSQIFANLYLNELDQFVKHNLGVKYYVRYMDDVAVLDSSIDCLFELKAKIQEFLKKNLNLRIHSKKTYVTMLDRGVNLLGYRVFYFHKLLKRGNVKRLKARLNGLSIEYKRGNVSLKEIRNSVVSWRGHAKHANTYNLRKNVLADLEFLAAQ